LHKKISIILFFLFSLSLFAQEISENEESDKSLYEATLYNDISTASYYELLNWCRELELDENGNADQLRSFLYSFYDINLNAQFHNENSESTIVKIVSADSTEYYTIDEVEEEYIRISGRVKLIVKQGGRNITHSIEADTVIFNKTIDTMTASGNILYIKEEDGKEEEYTGDNLTFNVKSWKGVILKGDFKKNQEVDGQEMEFIFSGESILKGEGDVVVLEDGSISSCDIEDKHYQIKAKKIWILGPDEWALLGGTLFIGNIPVLYFPFYHLPGNDMFFNPAVGVSTRNGYYIQTTTYLLGKKKSSEGDDSFFINVGDSDKTYNLVREGLFLFKEVGEEEQSTNDYIKYKLDYYSKLGAFTGIEGSIADLWKFKTINFDLGIAVSKSISTSDYSNFFAPTYETEWNSSDFFGVSLPFRWGASLSFSFFTFNTNFEYYSDPYFTSDFNKREENFEWLNYLLAQTTSEDEVYSESNSKTSLQWSINGNLALPNQWAGDYINNFSFNSINANIIWSTADNEVSTTSIYDPGKKFFYPSTITFPQTTLLLSGVLLNFSTSGTEKLPDQKSSDEGELRSPWSGKDDLEEIEEEDDESFREPENLDNVNIINNYDLFSTKIDYRLSGYFNYMAYTDSSTWNDPSQINFSTEKSTFTNNNTFNLNYGFSFLDNIFSLSGTNSFITNYLKYYGNFSTAEEDKEKDSQKITWKNTLNLKILPLKKVSYFNNTSINYVLDTNIYRRLYDTNSFQDLWLDLGDTDSVTAHKASVNFQFTVPFLTTTLLFDTTIPPQDIEQSITPGLKITFFNWVNSADFRMLYKDGDLTYEPLNLSSVFTPIDKITISEKFQYSLEDSRPESSVSTIRLWDFTATLNAAYSPDYEWDIAAEKLKPIDPLTDYKFLLTSLSMSYNLNYESPLLWKNRMTMGLSVNTSLNMNLQQYNLSSLNFTFAYNLHIFQFLDFNIKLNSSNDHMFLYFPFMRDHYGITDSYSFLGDLFKSFNVFSPNQQDRLDSFFNMNSIEVSLVHKLHDWDLEFSYSGKPYIEDGTSLTKWDSTLSILVRWNPIEKIKVKVDHSDGEWNADTEFND